MATDEERLLVRLEASSQKLMNEMAKASADFRRRVAEIDGAAVRSNKRVTDSLQQAGTSYRRTGRDSREFGMQVQNASYQIGDFAVQVASGTDASRALAQQLPQLLGGFGVVGAVAGAAAAIVLPLAGNFLFAGESAVTAADQIKQLEQALSALRSADAAASVPALEMVEKYGAQAGALKQVLEIQRQIVKLEAERAMAAASGSLSSSLGGAAGSLEPERLALISEAFDEVIRRMRETGAEFVDVLALYDGIAADSIQDIFDYSDSITQVQRAFGVSSAAARELLQITAELNASDTTAERAEAAQRLAQSIYDSSDGLRDATPEALELYNRLLDAAAAGLEIQSLDIASAIGAGADEAARLSDNLIVAANAQRQLDQMRIEFSPAGRAMSRYGGRGTSVDREITDGQGNVLRDGKFVDPDARSGSGRRGGRGGSRATDPETFMRDRLAISEQAVEAAKLEAQALFMGAEAATEARVRLELLRDAKRQNIDLDKQSAKSGLTVREEIDRQAAAIARLTVEAEQYKERAQFMAKMNNELKDGFIDAIIEGKSFGDVLENLAKSLARAALEAALFGSGPFAGGGGGGGLLGGLFSGIFGGFREKGGPVQAGRAYVVGEKQPELFVPGTSGTIIPSVGTSEGGKSEMVVRLSPGLEAAILQKSAGQTVQIVDQFSREVLPRRVEQISRSPRRVG